MTLHTDKPLVSCRILLHTTRKRLFYFFDVTQKTIIRSTIIINVVVLKLN